MLNFVFLKAFHIQLLVPPFNWLTTVTPLVSGESTLHQVLKYGVRSPPKLNSYLNFIANYKILHSSFKFRIIGKRFYTCLLFFKLNSFLWPCSPYIFNSLHQITLAESYFKLDLENFQHDFWIFVHASVIVDQDHLSGGGSWLAL